MAYFSYLFHAIAGQEMHPGQDKSLPWQTEQVEDKAA